MMIKPIPPSRHAAQPSASARRSDGLLTSCSNPHYLFQSLRLMPLSNHNAAFNIIFSDALMATRRMYENKNNLV
jgi:hypothetical protein